MSEIKASEQVVMDQAAITAYINETFAGTNCVVTPGGTFFIYDPERNLPANYQIPFATIVTSDEYDDGESKLSRPGVFRLNVGVKKETFEKMFGPAKAAGGHDLAALDRVMPHPVYGMMHWVCVLNPSEGTFEKVKGMLAESYEIVVKRAGTRKT